MAAIAAAAGLAATPASASNGCTAVNNGTLNHTSNLSDSTFQVVTRAVNAGLTVEQFTAGEIINYSYTVSNPNGGTHAYYRPTNAAGGNAASVAFVGTSTNVSPVGDSTASGSGSVTLPANITDIYIYDTQQNPGTTATVTWTVTCTPLAAAPTVTSLAPTSGPVGGGSSVALTGTGFTGTTAVQFGALAATGFTVNSATSITATAPAAAAAGVVNVTATNSSGTSVTAAGNQFTYVAPTVTGVSPGVLTAGATGSITITGTSFVPGNTSVSVGGTAATGVSCASATSCTATAPARAAGTYNVVVTTGSVASATSAADQVTYASAPTVAAAFSPGSITTAQTSTLTVTLTNGNAGTALTGVALATSTLPAGLTGSGSGTTCSGTLSATGTTFALSGASLVAGASCTVTLTVTPPTGAATYNLTTGAISATGPIALTGTTANATLTTTLPPLTTTQSTPSVTGTVGTALTSVTPVTASGGTTPYSFALTGGTLPTGLAFSTATGELTGTPTTALTATSFTVTATDATTPTAQTSAKTFQLTVAQGTQTITFAALADASLSASPLTLAATASSGLAVVFTSATTGVCTVAGTSVTLLTTGLCTINADQAGNANITAAPQVQRSFTVTPATLAVTPGAVTGASVGGSYSQANPATGGTAPYSYTLATGALPAGTTLGAGTGTVTGTPTTAGAFSYAIRATDSQGVPVSATGATVSGTIAQGTQTITFAALADASLSASPLTLAATASSGLAVVFTSATTGVCTVAGTSVTLLTTGLCTINADQAGNANLTAAPQVQRSFTVTPATLAVTPGAVTGASVSGSYSQANPATGGTAPYSYTLASGALPAGTTLGAGTGAVTGTPTAAGAFSYAIRATDSQGVPVSATGATVSGTIAQGTQTITFAALTDASLSASPLTLAATASSGLAVVFTSATTGVCTVAGTSVTLITTGLCTLNADQSGNANLTAAPQVQRSFTVTAGALAVTPGAVTGASVGGSYSQANPATGGTAPYSYTLATGALPAGTTLGAGTGTVTGTPTTAGAFSYAIRATDSQGVPVSATSATVSGTIAQGTQTITFAALTDASLSASPLTLAATASSGLAVVFTSATTGVCTVAGTSVTLLTTGLCTINADQPGNANLTAAPQVQRSFTVTPATLAVTPGAVTGASVGGSYSQANPATGGTAPYSYTLATGALPAGTTLGAGTGTVTGTPTTAGAFSYAIRATDSQGVPVSATGATVAGIIAQGTQTITFAALADASLSASPLTLAATASSGLAVVFTSATTGVCTVAGTSVTLLTTGLCTISADQSGNANFTAAPQVQRSFTVTPATLAVTPGAVTGASVGGSYSQANPATGGTAPYGYTLATGALPAGTTLGASTGTVTGTPTTAGAFSYAIRATDSQGFPVSATGATVSGTIAQGAQTITFAALADASLSASPLTLAATASSGLAVAFTSATTGVCTVAGTSVTLLTTGLCTINADQAGNANFTAAPQVQRSFTVTPATLAVTPGDVTGAGVGGSYSQTNPATGGTAPYSYTLATGALPAGTTLGAGTGTVTGTPTTAGAFSYAIRATDSQGVPVSATGATVSGTIAQGTQTITFAALTDASLSASPLTLAATASSGLAVVFTSATTGVCTVAGTSVTLLTTGLCTINADQPGNANIIAAPQVQRSFTVTPATLAVTPGAVTGASVGGSYSQANPASGGTAPYSYTLASGALPAGTTLGAGTGTVTGTPTTAGAFSYAIRATDSQGVPVSATSATVSGTIAQGTQTITFAALTDASLSASPLTLAATASSGLAVVFTSATTGVCTVAGTSVTLLTTGLCTINADQPGNANITAAPQVQRSFTVTPATLAVTPGAVTGASVGSSYSQANPASGGTAPYSYTLATGALPAGTTLGVGTGTVTGTPTTAGAFSYAIRATDSQGVPVSATGATVSGTIAQGTQTITFAALADASLSASPLTLAATASSGLAVVFTSATTGVCTVAGTSVTLLTTGLCTISADQAGNANFTAAPQVQRSFTVTAGAPVVADRNGVSIDYNSTGTPIDLATSVSGVFSSLSIASVPTHGTATLAGTVVTYTPTTGYFGPDSFTVTATGTGGTSPAGTVRLTVATPPAPIATPVAQTVPIATTVNTQGVEINLSDQINGVFSTIEISQAPQNGTVILTANAAAAARAPLGTVTSQATAAPIIAVYTPRVGYVGSDAFQFTAVGPGGRSAPGTVSLTIVGTPPTARAKQATAGDGETVLIDLTDGATGGPFTGATIVSITPAASAATTLVEAGPAGNRTYQLRVTPQARFGGTITIGYTLANASGTSAPAIVTVTVTARPDPTADPTVRAISDAQSESTRRFAQAQIGNFMRRNEQLHNAAAGRSDPLGFRFNSRDGRRGFFDPRFDNGDSDVTDRFSGGNASRSDEIGGFPTFGGPGGGIGGGRAGLNSRAYGTSPSDADAAPEFGAAAKGSDGRSVGGLAMWTGGAIEIGTRDATTRRNKITASTEGLSGGVDVRIDDAFSVGIGGGYGADLSKIGGTAGRVRANTSAVAAYGSATPVEGLFVDGVFGYGGLNFSTRRLVDNAVATGKRDGSMWFGALSAGIDRNTDALLWSVYGNVQWLDAKLGTYTETGAGRLNLRFDERQVGSLSSVLGGRIGIVQKLSFGTVTPQLRGEWQHEFNGSSVQALDYADIFEPSQYGISTIGWRRDIFTLSLGSRWVLPRDWGLDLDLGVRGASGQTSGQLRGQITKKF